MKFFCSICVEVAPSASNPADVISNIQSMYEAREGPENHLIVKFLDVLASYNSIVHMSHFSLDCGLLYRGRDQPLDDPTVEFKTGLAKKFRPVNIDGKVFEKNPLKLSCLINLFKLKEIQIILHTYN